MNTVLGTLGDEPDNPDRLSPSARSKVEKEVVARIARLQGIESEAKFRSARNQPHIAFRLSKIRPWCRVAGHRDRVRLERLERIEAWSRTDRLPGKRNLPVLFCSKDRVEEHNYMAVIPAEDFFWIVRLADIALQGIEAYKAEEREERG